MPADLLAFAAIAYGIHRMSQRPARGALSLGDFGGAQTGKALVIADEARLLELGRQAIASTEPPARGRVPRGNMSMNQRIGEIRRLIRNGSMHPQVRKVAGWVVARRRADGSWQVREKDWKGEAVAMFDFVRRNMRYTKDNALADTFVAAHRTLFDRFEGAGGIGDCDDAAITLGALLTSIGHEVKLRIGAVRNSAGERPDFNHIWLSDVLPEGGAVTKRGSKNNEFPLDASVPFPAGWQAPKNRLYKTKDFPIR